MKIKFVFISLLFINFHLFSQKGSDKQKAYDFAMEAIKLIKNGDYDESIKLIEKSCKLDPDNFKHAFLKGNAYFLKKDYSKSVSCFEDVIRMKGVNVESFQLLGESYYEAGKPDSAIEIYKKGLIHFPTSGKLYLELGHLHYEDTAMALKYYKKGIEVEPRFSSNYFHVARIFFCNSTEKVWGMIYGEIFMNLEPYTIRTEIISEFLFETYQSQITFETPEKFNINFCKNPTKITTDSKLPFGTAYEECLTIALPKSKIDTITLKNLVKLRFAFLEIYYDKDMELYHKCLNPLIDRHKELIDSQHFESYTYWILKANIYSGVLRDLKIL